MDKGIIVIKIGTAVLCSKPGALDMTRVKSLTGQVSELLRLGYRVVIVSSGAIGAGMEAMGLNQRPKQLGRLQACAAIGQGRLMKIYEESFKRHGIHTAQLLLTQEDFNDRKRFLNAKHTIMCLIDDFRVVPVVNENDTIATDEIRLGDNDRLSSLVASLVGAHTLVILTCVDGLYSPADKKVIHLITHISRDIEKMVMPSKSCLGVGGMATKLEAAKVAMSIGTTCIIANGKTDDILLKIEKKLPVGTIFMPDNVRAKAKKRWLAFSPRPKGSIIVDIGARNALIAGNKSLLAAGVKSVDGRFDIGDVVSIYVKDGQEFAKGVVNFSCDELIKIKGLSSQNFQAQLDRKITHNEVIHRDNLVILRADDGLKKKDH